MTDRNTDKPETTGRLLSVDGLQKSFAPKRSLFAAAQPALPAIREVSLEIGHGEIVGLVGESGSGKSTLGRAIVGLVEADGGSIRYHEQEITGRIKSRPSSARQKIQIVFQDTLAALSPKRSIGQSLLEPLEQFQSTARAEWQHRCQAVLDQVGLDSEVLTRLPHEMSAGQRQRIGLARALLAEPDLIVADEVVSALDVSVQAQIITLIRKLRADHGISFLFISHDLAVVAQLADRVAVMFRGRIVEQGNREDIFIRPAHPYTRELLSAVPDPDPEVPFKPVRSGGIVRSASATGCAFAARCPDATPNCHRQSPAQTILEPATGHRVECLLYE